MDAAVWISERISFQRLASMFSKSIPMLAQEMVTIFWRMLIKNGICKLLCYMEVSLMWWENYHL